MASLGLELQTPLRMVLQEGCQLLWYIILEGDRFYGLDHVYNHWAIHHHHGHIHCSHRLACGSTYAAEDVQLSARMKHSIGSECG